MNYSIIFNDIDSFYRECDIQEPTGNKCQYIEVSTSDDEYWVGLSLEKIKQSKYFYKEGLDLLKEIELDASLAGSRKKYKWDDQDGDDLSVERLNDDMPFLSKRLREHGDSNGKFVNIYVNIGENCGVDFKGMLNKSYTAIQMIDYLENNGYKVGVVAFSDVYNLGYYKGDPVNLLHVEVVIKKPEDPLIKPLLLTCISPWMLRHHFFKFWTAKFDCNWGLGRSEKKDYKDDKNNLYINTGECLTKQLAEEKIEFFKKLFKDSENE